MDSIKIFFNNTIIESADFLVDLNNRAFQYGDGVFETLVTRGQHVLFWTDHLERLQKGMRALQLHLPDNFPAQLQNALPELLENEKQHYRLKIMVWRQSGGLYTPKENKAQLLMMAKPMEQALPVLGRHGSVGIAEEVHLSPSNYSAFKTMSSLPYVLAGLEKKRKHWDELILLNTAGHLVEASSSNLFWGKGHEIFTPAVATGCVAGILRKQILRYVPAPFIIQEVEAPIKAFEKAHWAFTSNVTGIHTLQNIEKKALEEPPRALLEFIKSLYA